MYFTHLRCFVLALAAWLAPIGAASAQNFGNSLVATGDVEFFNRSPRVLFVAFSVESHLPAQISWTPSCARFNNEVRIAPGERCRASVPFSVGPARFCASEYPSPAGKTANCGPGNRTIIEANFTSDLGCRLPGEIQSNQKNCTWYDIRVVPPNCTDCDWLSNNCRDAGGPAYNVPVALSCAGAPTFTCRGPIAPVGPYGAKYPAYCGAPYSAPNCVGGLNPTCLQAYFYPMSTSGACKYPTTLPQPNGRCPDGQTLFVTFLEGY